MSRVEFETIGPITGEPSNVTCSLCGVNLSVRSATRHLTANHGFQGEELKDCTASPTNTANPGNQTNPGKPGSPSNPGNPSNPSCPTSLAKNGC